jgi:hypothetical protein
MTTVSPLHPNDNFHPSNGEPWWFESFWFSFYVPERRMMVYVYPWFRPGTGIAGGGVLAWDDGASEPWNIPHCDYHWYTPCPDTAALVQDNVMQLPQGITITCLRPQQDFRLQYATPRFSLDVIFRGHRPANVSTQPIGDSQLFGGRIDQCGHIQGTLTIDDEIIAVDCQSMRDRSWGIRRDDNYNMNIGYFHATLDAERAFLAVSDPARADGDTAPIVGGYLVLDGDTHALTSGHATLLRNADSMPIACIIDARDAAGRPLQARGTSISPFAYQPFPGMFNWSALATWEFNGQHCYGELQNTLHPDGWRALRQHRSV